MAVKHHKLGRAGSADRLAIGQGMMRLRELAGLDVLTAAARIGVTKATVYAVESGGRMSLDVVLALVQAYTGEADVWSAFAVAKRRLDY